MPPIPGLRVVRSSIHGYGVIAARPFRSGELIGEVDGVAWLEDEDRDDTYSLWIDDGIYYDMVDQTRWINHSCDPNASIDAGVEPTPWARIVALRDIAAGEEIAYDYGFPAHLAEPCACSSVRCRGWIVDEDELPLVLARRRRRAGAARERTLRSAR